MGIITFNGVSSNSFGIEVSSPPRYVIPEEDVAQMHIPGVNGDKLRRYRSFKNIQANYPITFLAPKYQYGDVDMDGSVTAADATKILHAVAEPPTEVLTPMQQILADVNHDGVVSDVDAFLVLNGIVNNETFATNSVGYMSSFIGAWLHPYYTDNQLEVKEVESAMYGVFSGDKNGYLRLSDTYNPDFFRKAFCKNATEIVNVYEEGGAANLVFELMPQKFYTSGEVWSGGSNYNYTTSFPGSVDATNTKAFINPSRFQALPLIRIHRHPDYDLSILGDCEGTLSIENVYYSAVTFTGGNWTVDLDSPWITRKTVRFQPFYGSMGSSGDMYIDFQNGNAFSPRAAVLLPSREEINGYIKSRITPNTGLLIPGINIIGVKVTRPNDTPLYPSFEVLPRWWTL